MPEEEPEAEEAHGPSFVALSTSSVTTPEEVHALGGFSEKEASPEATQGIIDKAQVLALHDVANRVHGVLLRGPIDGTNKRFQLPRDYRGRVFLDATLTGEKDSVQVHLRKVGAYPWEWEAATVASVDALHGQVVLEDAPDHAFHDRVSFTGFLVQAPLTLNNFKAAVELLACHLLDQRLKQPGTVTYTNPNAGGVEQQSGEPKRSWLARYKEAIARLRNAQPRAASVPMRRSGLW